MRELLLVDPPIAQACSVRVACAVPAVIHHEHFDPKLCRLLGELYLVAFILAFVHVGLSVGVCVMLAVVFALPTAPVTAR